MRGAEAIDKYIALPQQEAFDIEYWLLEEAKRAAPMTKATCARASPAASAELRFFDSILDVESLCCGRAIYWSMASARA